jgi:hypothetical protein
LPDRYRMHSASFQTLLSGRNYLHIHFGTSMPFQEGCVHSIKAEPPTVRFAVRKADLAIH